MTGSSKLFRLGAPMLIGVLILAVAIARAGAGDPDDASNGDVDVDDEYRVERVSIDSVDVRIAESYPVQIFVDVNGYLPDPCWNAMEPSVEQDGNRFEVEIVAERKADEMCPQVIEDYEYVIALGSPDPGDYVINVNGVEQAFEVP
jgi:hypothetical protein